MIRSSVVTLSGDGTWRKLTVSSGAASGGTSLGVEIVTSLVAGTKAQVDDVSLKSG
jgi:hypothetical protein